MLKGSRADAVVPIMRRVGRLLIGTVALGVLLAPAPGAARVPQGRLGVGDSIMLSSKDELAAVDIAIRAEVGRQFDEGLRVVRRLAAKGVLPKRVIVHLGTNGWIDPADCDTLVDLVGKSRRVFLVTVRVPRDWMQPNNATIRSCAAMHERAHLIRWSTVSGRHPEWFADDGYHLNADGQRVFARFVDREVDAVLAALRTGTAR